MDLPEDSLETVPIRTINQMTDVCFQAGFTRGMGEVPMFPFQSGHNTLFSGSVRCTMSQRRRRFKFVEPWW